jgi:hypothetical protein
VVQAAGLPRLCDTDVDPELAELRVALVVGLLELRLWHGP